MGYVSEFPPVYVAVDVVVLTVRPGGLSALLVERGTEPQLGTLALPGGFVRQDESLVDAARRELVEETGIAVEPTHLEQLASYGDVDRDPRARTVSVAYLAVLPQWSEPVAGTDAAGAAWYAVENATAVDLALRSPPHPPRRRRAPPRQDRVHASGDRVRRSGVQHPRAPHHLRGNLGPPPRCRQLPPQGPVVQGIPRRGRRSGLNGCGPTRTSIPTRPSCRAATTAAPPLNLLRLDVSVPGASPQRRCLAVRIADRQRSRHEGSPTEHEDCTCCLVSTVSSTTSGIVHGGVRVATTEASGGPRSSRRSS